MTNCGTLQWMANEVLANQRYSFSADIYSLAIVMWEICEASPPYPNCTNPTQIALAVVQHNLRPEISTSIPSVRKCPFLFPVL